MKDWKVLVIGDSFGLLTGKDTWLMQLSKKFDWNITNYSIGGSGPLYLIYKFLFLHENNGVKDFDLVLFLWSEPFRHFAPGDPRLSDDHTGGSDPQIPLEGIPPEKKRIMQKSKLDLWNFKYFSISHIGDCLWMDYFIKNNYADVKFWHFHCFPYYEEEKEHFQYAGDLSMQKHYHFFSHGVNITPSLAYFSINDNFKNKKQMLKKFAFDTREGHLGQREHDKLFKKLSKLVEMDYQNGSEYLIEENASSIELGPYSIRT